MKKILAIVSTFAFAALALTGCGGGDKDAATDTKGDAIKIGANYELSGAVATYGQDCIDGIELAVKEINANGGINGSQVELVKVDNKSETAEATSVATKLAGQGVVTILGPATSGNYKATIPVAESNKVPIVSCSATADDVTNADGKVYDYVFRTCFSDSFQGTGMAIFAKDNLKAKTAVIIQDTSSDYAKGLAENFKTKFEADGGKVVGTEGYISGDTDFNGILTKVKAMDFDVVYLPGYYSEVGLIVKQARDLGITAPFLGGDGYDSPTLLELAGAGALNDVYFTNHYSALDQDPKVIEFQKAFKAEKSKDASAFNALGYDLGYFVADAIERAGSTDPAEVQKAFASTKDFSGVTGTITVDENHNAVKSLVVIQLKDGVPASAEKVEVK